MDKKVMFNLSYGLFVLTANRDGKDNGCIINTVTQVTSEPNMITIAVNKANYTRDMISDTGVFTVSIISQDAAFDLFTHFGFQSGKNVNKFADFPHAKRLDNGTLCVTKGTNAYISAKVEYQIELSTHTLFIAEVTDMEMLSDAKSATYDYYHNNIKPKPAAKSEAPAGKTIWRCSICGYVYEGEELPADFICPLCKHPASDFEKEIV